jgi:hypothetical protein
MAHGAIPFDLFPALRMSGGGRFVRLGRVSVGFVRVLRGGGVIAFFVMLGRGAVRLCSSFVMIGGFRVSFLRHKVLPNQRAWWRP